MPFAGHGAEESHNITVTNILLYGLLYLRHYYLNKQTLSMSQARKRQQLPEETTTDRQQEGTLGCTQEQYFQSIPHRGHFVRL
jgi:hypothetical protein